MPFFPSVDGSVTPRNQMKSYFARFTLDPESKNLQLTDPQKLCDISGEFSRIDDRFLGLDYEWTYIAAIDNSKPYDVEKSHGRPFPGFNSVGRMNNRTGKVDYWWAGPTASVGEPQFIPRSSSAVEGDGYLMSLVNRFDTNLSDLVILDTKDLSQEIAMVHLPFRVRAGFHGNWVEHSDMGGAVQEIIDMEWVPATYDGPIAAQIHGRPTDVPAPNNVNGA